MLLNWNTIDACFLSSDVHIRSNFTFFLSCLAAFLLVISLEFLRRLQRGFDRYLRARNVILRDEEYVVPEEMEEKLLDKDAGIGAQGSVRRKRTIEALEQILRGFIHTVQFGVSYCVMLLFMYSNGSYLPALPVIPYAQKLTSQDSSSSQFWRGQWWDLLSSPETYFTRCKSSSFVYYIRASAG